VTAADSTRLRKNPMSRQADESKGTGKRSSSTKKAKSKGNLVNYSPTKEVVDSLREGIFGVEEAVEVLDELVVNGHRISMGANLDRGGYFVILREGLVDWQQAISVSFWGKDLARAIRLAAFYLREVNEDFPEGVQHEMDFGDW
jgi:hypothetical protein